MSEIINLPDEIWKPIKGYEGQYEISNKGRVKSLLRNKEKIMKLSLDAHGYYVINLYTNKSRKVKKVHRLIAEAFIPNPNNFPYIDHVDTNPQNNNIENLRWCTHKENLNNPNSRKNMSDYWSNEAIRTEHRFRQPHRRSVDMLTMEGVYIRTFDSIIEAAKYVNDYPASISRCCKGRQNSVAGHKWRFSNP